MRVDNKLGGISCRCPTPRGVKIEGGWDTSTHGEALRLLVSGRSNFVPPVRPLDALEARVCARAPVETRSRGGTPGTKSESSVYGRERPSTPPRLSHPPNPAYGTRSWCGRCPV